MKSNAFRQRYHARGSGLVWNASIRRRKGTGGPVTPEITFDELVASLISAGETVAFYDPNDLTSVYTARTGGANAVADGPVGLMLDKSQMGGLTAAEFIAAQPELVTNGTFDTDVGGWSTSASVFVSSGSEGLLTCSSDPAGYAYQSMTLTSGKAYKLTFDVTQSDTSFWAVLVGVGFNTSRTTLVSSAVNGTGTYSAIFIHDGSKNILTLQVNGNASTITIDNISIKELPGYHATAPSDAARPILRDVSSTYALDFDNVDDAMSWTTPAITDGTWIALTRNGSYAASAAYSAGTYTMPTRFQPFDLCAILWTSADLTTVQEAIVLAEGTSRGAAADFGGVTDFTQGWRGRSDLRDFPVIDTSSGTIFLSAWRECPGLTSFPILDTSSGTNFGAAWLLCSALTSFPALDVSSGTTFNGAWAFCTSLTTFPANMFDSVTATDFTNAFQNTNLTQTSTDNILTSINTANTSGGTFNQSGGSAPSATGEAAIDDLVSRGWTVTVTGGYVARTILTRSGQAIFDRFGSYIKERAV
jgi:hypothetical protein